MREVADTAGTGIYIGFVVATRDVISSRMPLAPSAGPSAVSYSMKATFAVYLRNSSSHF